MFLYLQKCSVHITTYDFRYFGTVCIEHTLDVQTDRFYSGACSNTVLQFLYPQISQAYFPILISPIRSLLCKKNRIKPNMPPACVGLGRLCTVCMANIQKSHARFQK